MLLTVPAMWMTSIWLMLYVIHSQLPVFGSWMNLFFSTIIDLNFLILYITMIFVLFDKKISSKTVLGKFITKKIEQYRESRRERRRQQELDIEMDREVKQSLTAPQEEDDDTD